MKRLSEYWKRFAFVAGLAAALPSLAAAPAEFPLRENEIFVHVVAPPFGEGAYEPRLEALLLTNHASRGLRYRRINNYLSQLLPDLESRVLVHRPTVVMVQTGNRDLVRQRHFDYSTFPAELEKLLGELTLRKIRVIVCSPVPVGNGSTRERLLPPMDGLKQWTEAARTLSKRHGAAFVDLFSAAIEWPMIGMRRAPYQYDAAHHRRSFELLSAQLAFPPSTVMSTHALETSPLLQADKAAFKQELARGEKLAAELSAVAEFKLPKWVKADDINEQRAAAMQRITRELEAHDRALARMVRAP